MKLREKKTKKDCFSSNFNIHSLNEIIVGWPDGNRDSDYISNYDVWIEALSEWKDMRRAFRDKDIITNNYNDFFFEPRNKEDRERGFTL